MKQKTVGDLVEAVQKSQQRAAVYRAISAFLRTRYLPRDSVAAASKISYEGGAVPELMIEEIACELEEQADDQKVEANKILAEKL